MKKINITKGLDLKLQGAPNLDANPEKKEVQHVAVVGSDYVGMKPTICVEEGERVLAGQLLFEDKKNPGVRHTSPGAGTVKSIVRGDKRAFLSIVVELDRDAPEKSVEFQKFRADELDSLCPNKTRELLVQSGFWTALRTRPYSRTPKLGTTPRSLFVTCADSNPHAPDPKPIIETRKDDFVNGLKVLSRICGEKLWVCLGKGSYDDKFVAEMEALANVEVVQFLGKHPSGLVGTHIAKLDPCGLTKTVWTIGYQDAIAIGELFTTGAYPATQIVTIAGPQVKNPRLLRVQRGAFVPEILDGELIEGETRAISGSVLCGRAITPGQEGLGRFANQISAIADGDPREFLGWLAPGCQKFSLAGSALSKYVPGKLFKMTTALHGGARSVFPNPAFYQVTPLDIEPTFLFKALEIGDIEKSEQLGALELDEEDLALCTLVDYGKNDYGKMLRALLNSAMKEEE